jgi:hypoxanthine phosphoribosyltransferase
MPHASQREDVAVACVAGGQAISKMLRCEFVSLERVYDASFQLAGAVRRSGFVTDVMIAIARGGFVPARLLCDFLGHSLLSSVTIRHYEAGGRKLSGARITAPVSVDVRDRRVLVVDDVNDSGETLVAARDHLTGLGAREVRCAVLHEKETSHVRVDFVAERVTGWRWMLYQWALTEDVTAFARQIEPRPSTRAELASRLERDFGLRLPEVVLAKLDAALEWGD